MAPVHIYPGNELPFAYGDIYRFRNENLYVSRNGRHLLPHRHILFTVIGEYAYFGLCSSSEISLNDALEFEPDGTVIHLQPDGEGIGNCLTEPTHVNCNDVHCFPISKLDDMHTDGAIEIMGAVNRQDYERLRHANLDTDDSQPDLFDSMTWGNSYP